MRVRGKVTTIGVVTGLLIVMVGVEIPAYNAFGIGITVHNGKIIVEDVTPGTRLYNATLTYKPHHGMSANVGITMGPRPAQGDNRTYTYILTPTVIVPTELWNGQVGSDIWNGHAGNISSGIIPPGNTTMTPAPNNKTQDQDQNQNDTQDNTNDTTTTTQPQQLHTQPVDYIPPPGSSWGFHCYKDGYGDWHCPDSANGP